MKIGIRLRSFFFFFFPFFPPFFASVLIRSSCAKNSEQDRNLGRDPPLSFSLISPFLRTDTIICLLNRLFQEIDNLGDSFFFLSPSPPFPLSFPLFFLKIRGKRKEKKYAFFLFPFSPLSSAFPTYGAFGIQNNHDSSRILMWKVSLPFPLLGFAREARCRVKLCRTDGRLFSPFLSFPFPPLSLPPLPYLNQ